MFLFIFLSRFSQFFHLMSSVSYTLLLAWLSRPLKCQSEFRKPFFIFRDEHLSYNKAQYLDLNGRNYLNRSMCVKIDILMFMLTWQNWTQDTHLKKDCQIIINATPTGFKSQTSRGRLWTWSLKGDKKERNNNNQAPTQSHLETITGLVNGLTELLHVNTPPRLLISLTEEEEVEIKRNFAHRCDRSH